MRNWLELTGFQIDVFKNPTNMNSLLKILKTVTTNPLLGQRLLNEKNPKTKPWPK